MSYRIITDSCCDLPEKMYKELNLTVVNMPVTFKGQTVKKVDDTWLKEMFDGLRGGAVVTTAAANPQDWQEAAEPFLAEGEDVLILAFSSGLSTTYQSAVIAATELMEQYPGRTVKVVDTLCASMGQGLLVYYACKKRDAGLSLEELSAWCEEKKFNLSHWFTVDDLMYLKRGGRVSAATALVGTMLQIKPVLHVDNAGHLINIAKVRGRKASIQALAKKMTEQMLPGENDTIFISHGDCWEDARYLGEMLKAQCGVKQVIINYVGASVGAHSGPGTLALFYIGKER